MSVEMPNVTTEIVGRSSDAQINIAKPKATRIRNWRSRKAQPDALTEQYQASIKRMLPAEAEQQLMRIVAHQSLTSQDARDICELLRAVTSIGMVNNFERMIGNLCSAIVLVLVMGTEIYGVLRKELSRGCTGHQVTDFQRLAIGLMRKVFVPEQSESQSDLLNKVANLSPDIDDKDWLKQVTNVLAVERRWITQVSILRCLEYVQNNNLDTRRKLQDHLEIKVVKRKAPEDQFRNYEKRYAEANDSERLQMVSTALQASPAFAAALGKAVSVQTDDSLAASKPPAETEPAGTSWKGLLHAAAIVLESSNGESEQRLRELGQLRSSAAPAMLVACLTDELIVALTAIPMAERIVHLDTIIKKLQGLSPTVDEPPKKRGASAPEPVRLLL